MKRILLWTLSSILCFTTAGPIHANPLWEWQYPIPQGNTLSDIDILNAATAIAAGARATVIKTTDGGTTWAVSREIQGLSTWLIGVSFADAVTAVAVGSDGVILRTANGGATWSLQASGTTDHLRGIDFGDATHGTAVGSNGTILRTSDGGVTWSSQVSGTAVSLSGVSFVDANTGSVVGVAGTILRTTDGGANWGTQVSGTIASLADVDFVDANTGTAVGALSVNPFALRTTDGGNTWTAQPMPSFPPSFYAPLTAVSFTDANNGVAVGPFTTDDSVELGLFMRTSNGGASWSSNTGGPNVFGVGMFDSSNGLAVGAVGCILQTTNGGAAWSKIGGGSPDYWMRGVDFSNSQQGVVVASQNPTLANRFPSSRLFYTADGGATWDFSPVGFRLLDVAFADANTAYAVGRGPVFMDSGAVIFKSTDSGATWSQFFLNSCPPIPPYSGCYDLSAVDFGGLTAGVAVGTEGRVVTIDGATAAEVSTPTTEWLRGVSMPTLTTAYAVGNQGVILKSVDSGSTWSALASGTITSLHDVDFSDETTGTAVGGGGEILRTTDGGANWTPQVSGTTASLTSVSFESDMIGVIGAGATMLTTINGGTTWVPEATPSPITDLVLIDLVNVAAVGGNSNIIARRDVPVPVFFRGFAARALDYSVELTWSVSSDESFEGFRLYRRGSYGHSIPITEKLIPVDVTSFTDRDVRPAGQYEYTLAAVHTDGSESHSVPVTVHLSAARAELLQNHPNPFNPTTTIRFALPERGHVTLNVFDVNGRLIVTLVDGIRPVGEQQTTWNGKDTAEVSVGSGVYFYQLRTRSGTISRKMVLLR